ncbi:MAG: hypothetical protein C4287_23230 [Leptolyngbya sp. ERB_1_2]
MLEHIVIAIESVLVLVLLIKNKHWAMRTLMLAESLKTQQRCIENQRSSIKYLKAQLHAVRYGPKPDPIVNEWPEVID